MDALLILGLAISASTGLGRAQFVLIPGALFLWLLLDPGTLLLSVFLAVLVPAIVVALEAISALVRRMRRRLTAYTDQRARNQAAQRFFAARQQHPASQIDWEVGLTRSRMRRYVMRQASTGVQ